MPTASSVPPPSKPNPEKRSRILLVDDEPSLVHAFAKCLRLEGHEVESAGDGASALEVLLSGQPFDLIFCDLMMRGLTGMELERALLERAPQRLSRIVFMSGESTRPRPAHSSRPIARRASTSLSISCAKPVLGCGGSGKAPRTEAPHPGIRPIFCGRHFLARAVINRVGQAGDNLL